MIFLDESFSMSTDDHMPASLAEIEEGIELVIKILAMEMKIIGKHTEASLMSLKELEDYRDRFLRTN